MKKYKLCDIATISSSKRIFANEYVKEGIPFYRGKEITQLFNHQNITELLYIPSELYCTLKNKYGVPVKNDILLTAVGTIGSVYLIKDEKFYFKDGNLIWFKNINNKIIDPKFLFYYFISNKMQQYLQTKAIGSSQPALTIESLKGCEILIPEIDEQQHIVNTKLY